MFEGSKDFYLKGKAIQGHWTSCFRNLQNKTCYKTAYFTQ